MLQETKTTEWNRDAKRAADVMAEFRSSATAPVSKNQDGLMVVVGDYRRESDGVFIGWAPEGGVTDLLRLVQFGNPYNLGILGWYPATVADVDEHRETLKKFQYRTDDTNWFKRMPQVDNYLKQVRNNVYGTDADIIEDDIPSCQASTLLPVKPIRQTSTLLPSIKRKPKQASKAIPKSKKSTRRKPGKNKQAKKQRRQH